MSIYSTPKVRSYFNNLITILFDKGYFGYEDNAKKYVDELLNDIQTNLPAKLHKPAPSHFEIYGKNMEYAVFKKNQNTSWYVFFSKHTKHGETIYLIRYIGNNHTIAHYL
jgi:polyhydroxyalkanoate synthesis regulator phasin